MRTRTARALTCALLVGLALAGTAQLQGRARRPVAVPTAEATPDVSLIGLPAPDFELPLAAGCRWRAPENVAAPRKSPAATPMATPMATPIATPAPNMLRFSDFRALRPASQEAKGDVTLLVFWAFWCDTWKDATQRFQRLRPQFERDGVRLLCVTVDASQQPVARGAFANGSIWYPVAIDGDSQVARRYGVRRVPTLFVVDAAGVVRARFEAFPSERRLQEVIRAASATQERS